MRDLVSPTIRPAAAADIATLIDMMEAFYAESGYSLERQWATDSFLALLRNKSHGDTWITCDGAQAVGYAVMTYRFSMEHGGLEAFVDDLFICPSHRRRGLGAFTMRWLIQEARQRGVHAVQVEVGRDDAAAHALYRLHGLHPHDDGRETLTLALRQAESPAA